MGSRVAETRSQLQNSLSSCSGFICDADSLSLFYFWTTCCILDSACDTVVCRHLRNLLLRALIPLMSVLGVIGEAFRP